MYRLTRPLLSLIAATALMAVEATPPVVSMSLPDVVHTTEQLLAGPYGRMWQQPAVQKLCAEMIALPGSDCAWLGMVDRIREVRYELVATAPKQVGQNAGLASCLGLRLPAGNDPQTVNGTARREGDWWLLGHTGATLALPVLREPLKSDVNCVIRLSAFAELFPTEDAANFRKILEVLGLDRIDLHLDSYPGGVRKSGLIAGSKLPFKAVDADALAGFPEHPLSLIAVGIDGQALVRLAKEIGLQSDLRIGLDSLLSGCDGTVVFAVTPGAPFPGMTLSLPASAAIDALIGKLSDWREPGSGAHVIAEARTRSVRLPMPPQFSLSVMLRRLDQRWVISSDQPLIDSLAAAKPAPFAVQNAWKHPDGAVVLALDDTKVLAQTLLGYLPMLTMGNRAPVGKHWDELVQDALVAVIPHLQPGALIMRNDTDGLRLEGENGMFADLVLVQLSVLAGKALLTTFQIPESTYRANARNHMRQILRAAIVYQNNHDESWPADFAELKKWSDGDLDDKLFQCPGHPEIEQPFLYVRPSPTAKSVQPVILQDPACNRGQGSMVAYADGHVSYEKGAVATAMWEEAKRLATSPKAKTGGIETHDWTTPPDIKAQP
jgi:prepilin-type processing-associated H-X9-DG protein